jgi:prolyl oligopeptidase
MFKPHRLVPLLFIVALTAGQALHVSATPSARQSPPPHAPVRPVTETLHGVTLTDPYRWMEDGGQELTDWMKAQDAHTRRLLERIPGRQKLLTELRALMTDAASVAEPRRIGSGYLYLKRSAGQQVMRLYLHNAKGAEQVVVDPATLGDGKQRVTINQYGPSPDGRYVAYQAVADGKDIGSLRIVELATGRTMEAIDNVFYFNSWRPDSRAFTYTRGDTTYLHVLGTEAAADTPLLGRGITPRIDMKEGHFGGVTFSAASKYALAWVALNPGATLVTYYTAPIEALAGGETPWRRLAGADDQALDAVLHGDTAYLVTSRNAPRRQVIRTSLLRPDLARAELVVPQSEKVIASPNTAALKPMLYLAEDAVYVRTHEVGVSRLVRVPLDGSTSATIPLPFEGNVQDIAVDPKLPGVLFTLQSWTRAPRVYSFDPAAGTVTDMRFASAHPAERPGVEVTQVKARSADGTAVPLTIIARAGVKKDGSNPTLLAGYGAYGIVPEPVFRPYVVPWLERGGIQAICHARGGGEYGEAWHRGGQKENKRNTISDFIACAEHLISERYTAPARLSGFGASAGGITIGGAINRRPELFAAALPRVPVADLLRFERTKFGPHNVAEFGTVKDPNQFRAMMEVSPYTNIVNGTRYPAVMVVTSINDISVPPWQPAKLAARLQAATASGKPVLLRVDWGSGHLGGTTTSDQETMYADEYTFLLWQKGVSGFQPEGTASGAPSLEAQTPGSKPR